MRSFTPTTQKVCYLCFKLLFTPKQIGEDENLVETYEFTENMEVYCVCRCVRAWCAVQRFVKNYVVIFNLFYRKVAILPAFTIVVTR